MMMVNMKVAIQILKKSLYYKHPILQCNILIICIVDIIIIETIKIRRIIKE